MSFRVAMVIDGDASGALRAMQAAETSAKRLREGTTGLTTATTRLERSQRSSTAAAALLPPRLDQISMASGRAAAQVQRLPPALQAAAQGSDRFVGALRNTASTMALMHGPLGGIASRFSSLATIMSRLPVAAAAGAVGLGALTFAAGHGIRTFTDYERQLLTIEQVIRATGGSAGRSAADIDRLALGVARGTLASAREVRAASAQLLTFRSIAGDTFDRTLRLAQDLAAVGFGSIEQAAVQLAKALEDPEQGLAALRRVGVSFSAAQIEIIRNFNETGRVAEAQAAILAQVEAQVGGAGAAAAGGLAGAFDTLTGEMSRFFELVGRETATLINLQGALLLLGRGMANWNDAIGMDERESAIAALADRRNRLVDQLNRGLSADNPLTMTPARLEGRQLLEQQIAELNDRILALQRDAADEAEEIQRRSDAAQAESARERANAVVSALEAEIEAAGRTAVENEVVTAQRRAGVEAASAEGQAIAELVARKHEVTEATAAAARAEDEARREAERGQAAVQNLVTSLQLEIDVLRTADPVMAAMLRQRQALSGATADQAAAVRALVAELEAEQRARAFDDEIDRLQFDTSTQGMTELQRRQATAARRLNVSPDSDEGRQLAEQIRLNFEAEQARRQREAASRSGSRATAKDAEAVERLIAQLEAERDLLRETDPVQRELIRHREALASATAAQRTEIEQLVEQIERETQAAELLEERWEFFRETAYGALDDLILRGESFEDVLGNVANAIRRAALEAALLGTGPLAGLFGMQAGGGGLLGVLGGLFGIQRKADGGLIHGPGGPREDKVALAARPGDYIVNASATQRNRAVLEAIRAGTGPAVPVLASPGEYHMPADRSAPNLALLEAINAGADLQGLRPQRLALGGMVAGIPIGPPRLPMPRNAAGAVGNPSGHGGAPVYNFNVTTPDAKSFQSRATVVRGARRIVGMAERYS